MARDNGNQWQRPSREEAEAAVRTLIAWAGDDPGREGVKATPDRVVRAFEEYFDGFKEQNGDQWLVVTTIVSDPEYLTQPFVTSSQFKKERDGSHWRPTPCEAR